MKKNFARTATTAKASVRFRKSVDYSNTHDSLTLFCADKTDKGASTCLRPQETFANTYKTEPDEKQGFKYYNVKGLINDVLEETLGNYHYNTATANEAVKITVTELTNQVKALKIPRYKIVSYVTVGENRQQGVACASRSVLDENTDSFATAFMKRPSFFAVATVHGSYYE